MASSPKLISIFFLFAFISMQIQAREFFSKIPSVNNNEKEKATVPDTKEQEPRFIPETQNGYGLYGHESGQLPPSTTTKGTYEPYVTPVRFHPDEPYNSIPESAINNNNRNTYYNKNSYESNEQQNLGEAIFTEKGWSTKENQNNNNNYNKYNNRDTYSNQNSYESNEQQNLGETMFAEKEWNTKENQNNNNNNYFHYSGNNGYNNGERQGMSDTRFLENGKYYYNVKSENNYYPNQFQNSRGYASRDEFNGNRYNNMGRYNQNQEEFNVNEEDFKP